MHPPALCRLALVGLLCVATIPAQAGPSVVVAAGEVSPLGWPYSSFVEATVDGGGRTVFLASSTSVFGRDAGALHQRLGAGTVIPDGRRVVGVGAPALAAGGCVVARGVFEGGGDGILQACGTTFALLADAGDVAPSGGVIRAFVPTVFASGTDTVAFAATLDDGASVLLRHDGGGTTEVARTGRPTPVGGSFASFRLLGVSAAGRVGFRATVSGGPDGLFAGSGTAIAPIAVVGQGSPAGGSFSTIGGGTLNASDQWAFRATLSSQTSGVFHADASKPTPLLDAVVLDGDAVPIPQATLRGFPASMDPSISGTGAIAFRVLLADVESGSAVLMATPGEDLRVLAATRTDTPVGFLNRLRDPVAADDGSVVVQASVAGQGPGLFVSRGGSLTTLARLGDATDADTGDARFRFSGASVRDTAEGAVFLGQRDALFRRSADGSVETIAYTGRRTPLGGVFALLGAPVVDGRDRVFFGADVQGGTVNEALFTEGDSDVATFVSAARRAPGGGSFRELFPANVDSLGRPAGASKGVVFAAALQGTSASQGIFLFASKRGHAVARTGQRAGGKRLAAFGTPAVGSRGRVAVVAEVGRVTTEAALVVRDGGSLRLVTSAGKSTQTRIGGRFAAFDPPVLAAHGVVFRATLDSVGQEGLFLAGRGRIGLLAGSGDTTTSGDRIRTVGDPIVVGTDVLFLARTAGSVVPGGLYRVSGDRVPGRSDDPLPVTPVLAAGDTEPGGGVVVGLEAPRVGPSGVVTVVAELSGGGTSSAIVRIDPGAAATLP